MFMIDYAIYIGTPYQVIQFVTKLDSFVILVGGHGYSL